MVILKSINGVSMSNQVSFNPESYQKYVSDIRKLVSNINEINQKIISSNQDYATESYKAYEEHMQALMSSKNPMDYFNINRRYVQESSSRFQRLLTKRYSLFDELSKKLMDQNNIMFLFPQQIQDAILKFRQSGKMDMLNPDLWSKFTNMLTNRV